MSRLVHAKELIDAVRSHGVRCVFATRPKGEDAWRAQGTWPEPDGGERRFTARGESPVGALRNLLNVVSAAVGRA